MPSLDASPAPARHWIVPFAASLSEPCQHALPHLDAAGLLPHWQALMSQVAVSQRLEGDEYALSMPHERVMGAALGWAAADQPHADGLLPWAAWWAAQDGLSLDSALHWGLLSPGHWLMGREHLTLLDPHSLGLDEAQSRAAFDAVFELFDSDGWTLRWGSPERWYAAHPSLAGLPTASLDRVIGRNPDVWLTDHPQARMLRRLQSEVQMQLYQSPVNDAREAAGQPTLNSFWLSGCGQVPPSMALPAGTELVTTLRAPLLSDDMPLWVQAWQELDATVLKDASAALAAGQPVHITFCGERHAVTLARAAQAGLGARLVRALTPWSKPHTGAKPSTFLSSL